MAVTTTLKYLIALVLTIGVTFGCELTCNATIVQQRVECEPIECPEGYVLKEGKGKCGYCSACVHYAQITEDCWEETEISSERLYSSTECDEGLTCNGVCETTPVDSDDCMITEQGCSSCYDMQDELKTQRQNNPTRSDWVWDPKCYPSGRYKPVQCKGQRCYCTQQDGQRIFGHAKTTDGTQGTMNCECSLMEVELFNKAKLNAEYDHVACQTNGNYRPLQCLRNLCFCVNETTGEVDGMVLPKTLVTRLPCYDATLYTKSFEHACQIQRGNEENLSRFYHRKGYDLRGLSLTRCNPDGSYVPKQCDNINCYCGKPDDGQTIEATYRVPLTGNEELTMNCNCLRDRLEPVSLQQSPCEQNGNYEPVSCTQSNCHCLDSDGHQCTVQEDIKQWMGDPCSVPTTPISEEMFQVLECYKKQRRCPQSGPVNTPLQCT